MIDARLLRARARTSAKDFSSEELQQRMLERRAVEAVIWGMPIVSLENTLLVAWHIDQGRFGQIDLDGLNAVLAVYAPTGHMLEVKWKVALYVDERANQDQQNALTQIFSGQAGGHLAGFLSSFRGRLVFH
jgi:hypothetical protein